MAWLIKPVLMLPEASLYSPLQSGCQKHSSANCLHRSTACQKHTSVANSVEMEILGPVIDGERCWEMLRVSLCLAKIFAFYAPASMLKLLQVYRSWLEGGPAPSLSFQEPTQSTFTPKTEGVQQGNSRDEPIQGSSNRWCLQDSKKTLPVASV